jgi:hypothetical protein
MTTGSRLIFASTELSRGMAISEELALVMRFRSMLGFRGEFSSASTNPEFELHIPSCNADSPRLPRYACGSWLFREDA